MDALGPELRVKVSRITLNSGKITVIAESAAWAARVRFRLAEAESALRQRAPEIREWTVRVSPSRAATPKR